MVLSLSTQPYPDRQVQRIFNRCETVPLSSGILWRIERGVVRTLTYNEEGDLVALGFWGVGDVVGRRLSSMHPYQVECLTRVEARMLSDRAGEEAFEGLCTHIQQTEELLNIALQSSVPLRLWEFLVWLSKKFGRTVHQGQLIDVELTHQHIAEAINTTRVTVTRLLRQFENSGKLRREKRRLIVCV